MRRLALTMAALVMVGIGGWFWVRASPEPARPGQGGAEISKVAPGVGGAGPAGQRNVGGAVPAMPRLPHTLWRETTILNERRFVTWSIGTRPGGRYLLQYVCFSPGELHIRVRGTVDSWSRSVSCPGLFRSVQVVAVGDSLGVAARRLNHRHVKIVVQVVGLS